MRNYFLLFLILFCCFKSYSQQFVFKEINSLKIKEEIRKSDISEDAVYTYLRMNYNTLSQKNDIKKDEYSDYSICSFTQKFDNEIIYSIDECGEAKGSTILISVPLAEKKSLIKWVEEIESILGSGTKNVWNNNFTKYEPDELMPGCFYEIENSSNRTLIKIYCGC